MSIDLWDMAERATKIVKEQIKQDIDEDEMAGVFYQEFCKPTVAEKQYKIKVKWMLENGFKKGYCNQRKTDTFIYDDFVWIKEQVEDELLSVIKKYKDWYDGLITEEELDIFRDREYLNF